MSCSGGAKSRVISPKFYSTTRQPFCQEENSKKINKKNSRKGLTNSFHCGIIMMSRGKDNEN